MCTPLALLRARLAQTVVFPLPGEPVMTTTLPAISIFDRDDFEVEIAGGARHGHHVADFALHQRFAEWGLEADAAFGRIRFVRADDQVRAMLLVLVDDLDAGAKAHFEVRAFLLFDDDRVVEALAEKANSA